MSTFQRRIEYLCVFHTCVHFYFYDLWSSEQDIGQWSSKATFFFLIETHFIDVLLEVRFCKLAAILKIDDNVQNLSTSTLSMSDWKCLSQTIQFQKCPDSTHTKLWWTLNSSTPLHLLSVRSFNNFVDLQSWSWMVNSLTLRNPSPKKVSTHAGYLVQSK